MSQKKFWVLCLCTLFCFVMNVRAQENDLETVILKEYIQTLESKFDLKFTYIDSYVGKSVKPINSDNLTKIISSLEKQVHLRFEFVEDKKVVIRPFLDDDMITICGITRLDRKIQSGISISSVFNLKQTYSDQNGFFEIQVPYNSSLVFEFNASVLEKKKASELFKEKCPDLFFSIYHQELKEVNLWQYLTKGVDKKFQKIMFTPKKFSVIAGLTEPDVMQSLQHIPGVQSPFETASRLSVRGGTPDQNLVLWNGIKSYNQGHFFGLISSFNPYLIKEIDFYSKGVNAQFGDRVAGVIDLKSSQKVASKFEGGIGTNLIHADAFARVPIIKDRLSIEIAGRRSFNDLWESPTYKQMAERVFQNTKINESSSNNTNSFYFVDYSFSIQGKLSEKDDLQVNALVTKNDLSFDSSTGNIMFSDELITENEGYNIQWKRRYSDRFSQSTKVNLSNYALDYTFSNIEDDIASSEKEDSKQNFINDIGAQTFGVLKLGKQSSLQLGYEYSKTNIRFALRSRFFSISVVKDEEKSELDTHSVFSQYEIKSKNKFLLQMGVRGNFYSITNDVFIEPRLYLEVPVLPNVNVNTSFSLRSQAITQIQESVVSSLSLENQLWRVTDNEFDVLRTRQVSFGATYKTKTWFIEFDSYIKRTNNVTSLTTGFLTPDSQRLILGLNNVEGVEMFVKKKYKNYASWVSYSYTNQKNKFEDLNDNKFFTANLNIDHTFKWLHFYQYKKFQFSLSWLWHTGKAATDSDSVVLTGDGIDLKNLNEDNLPVYHKLDASMLYNFKFSDSFRYQLGFSVLNIYNRKSIINREFRSTPGSISKDFLTLNYEALGITPNLSLRVFW
ncbi:TonB-dependent receptor plug domain-containing protein [Aquimarina agarilytica]|uniref:TonB-dependent receptor plug domain-containing protein n=1 Tax=Aquimarina agarilytica TaxID=1087449 RepID=UPI0002883DAA|nr:TonB-dependent receptor plug domain-containing protein [Aquimarina agarilytica]